MTHKLEIETVDHDQPTARATVKSGTRGRPLADIVERLERGDSPALLCEPVILFDKCARAQSCLKRNWLRDWG
jgi:hypothetical protein